LVWGLDIFFVCFVVYMLLRSLKNKYFVGTIREFLVTLVFVSIIANVAGSLLDKISGNAIYRVYPAIIATIGGVGSIIGSTATTKLALGLIKPTFSSIKLHFNEIAGSWFASIIMFVVYGVLSLVISGGTTLQELLVFIGQLLTTNVLAVSIMAVIAYAVAIYTFRRGWNPDNFVIPIESSLADTLTTAAIIIALALIA
ncbi:MAG: magnesium transporter, partial [archaeon]